MDTKPHAVRLFYLLAIVHTACWFTDVQAVTAQIHAKQSTTQNERVGDERGIARSEEFISTRPTGNRSKLKRDQYRLAVGGNVRRAPRHNSRFKAAQVTDWQGQTYATIGVTIGRARRAREAEMHDQDIAKVLSQDGTVFVLERISKNATVSNGTLMQMMIEYLASRDAMGQATTNRLGYLYVINSVQYQNGVESQPRLIFPTLRTYGGDGRVLPGKMVTLPDPQRLWEITRNPAGPQAFETYLIIISPSPLKDRTGRELQGDSLSERPLELDTSLIAEWIKPGGEAELRADLITSSDKRITLREQAASGNPTANRRDTDERGSDLTQGDPPPQIVFRKVVKPGGKMLVTIKLPFKDTAATARSQP